MQPQLLPARGLQHDLRLAGQCSVPKPGAGGQEGEAKQPNGARDMEMGSKLPLRRESLKVARPRP